MSEENVARIYEGNVYLQLWIAGTLQKEMIGPLATSQLVLKPQSELKQRFSKQRGKWGKQAGSFVVAKPTQFTLGVNAVNMKVLAMAYQGTIEAQAIASGTITAEPVTLSHGLFVRVSQRNISAVAITGSVLGIDFVVDKKIGAIKALSTGNLADGVATTFNAVHGAITATRILGGTESKIDVQLVMDGQNKENLSEVYIRIPKIPLTLDSDIDLKANDYNDITFKGEIELLDTETAEFYIDNDVEFT